MERVNQTPLAPPERRPEASYFADSRAKIEKTLKILGLGAVLTVAHPVGEAIVHNVAADAVKAEDTPAALAYAHNKLGKEVNADAIATQISRNQTSDRVQKIEELDGIFSPDQIDGDRLVVGGRRFHVKIGSSEDFDRHFAVVNRMRSELANPQLIGMYLEQEGEDITPEEGVRLALQNAADNLNEAQQEDELMAMK